jgi:phage terminase small subunit
MPDDTPTTFDQALKKLEKRPRAFVLAYLESLNGTKAAKKAGYSVKTAAEMAYENLRKPHIKQAVELGFAEKLMSKGEILNRFERIATGTMEDFITLEEVEYREQIPVPAFQRREQLRARVADAREAMESVTKKEHLEAWQKIIDSSLDEIEALPENPLETVLVQGDVRKQVVARVDLVKAEQLGQLHLIRKLKQTERGLEVELYDAKAALEMLGKHQQLFTDRLAVNAVLAHTGSLELSHNLEGKPLDELVALYQQKVRGEG